MKKLSIQETYPCNMSGRDMVLARMSHHYRRVASAKPRVDTNLPSKNEKNSKKSLSADLYSIVMRNYSAKRNPPKHRPCLKYGPDNPEFVFKPVIYSTAAQSRLRSQPEIYHPATKGIRASIHPGKLEEKEIQTSLLEECPKTKETSVQTVKNVNYRPLDKRSILFLKDITDEALNSGVYSDSDLDRIFTSHVRRNVHGLDEDLMEREVERLSRALGMTRRSRRSSTHSVSDAEALKALDSLALDPKVKEDVIASLQLANDVGKVEVDKLDETKDEEEPQEKEEISRTDTPDSPPTSANAEETKNRWQSSLEVVDEEPDEYPEPSSATSSQFSDIESQVEEVEFGPPSEQVSHPSERGSRTQSDKSDRSDSGEPVESETENEETVSSVRDSENVENEE